jgi:hypothetical protein
LDRNGTGLQATFTWQDDQFIHTIVAVDGDSTTLLLHGDTSSPKQGLAPPPPLQEAVSHHLPDGRSTVLATGSGAGRYWSATVTPLTDVRFAMLQFEFACRRRDDSVPALAYRVADDVAASLGDDGYLRLRIVDKREFVLWAAPMPNSLATEFVPTCRLELLRHGLSIEATCSPHVTTKSTVAWKYEISAHSRREG